MISGSLSTGYLDSGGYTINRMLSKKTKKTRSLSRPKPTVATRLGWIFLFVWLCFSLSASRGNAAIRDVDGMRIEVPRLRLSILRALSLCLTSSSLTFTCSLRFSDLMREGRVVWHIPEEESDESRAGEQSSRLAWIREEREQVGEWGDSRGDR